MKNKRIDHVNKIMSKHQVIFMKNLLFFFKYRKNWKRAGISI